MKPAKCGPHKHGRDPMDPPYYDDRCACCRQLLAEGKRTGLEGRPPSKVHRFSQMNLALYRESEAKKKRVIHAGK